MTMVAMVSQMSLGVIRVVKGMNTNSSYTSRGRRGGGGENSRSGDWDRGRGHKFNPFKDDYSEAFGE